MAQQTARRDGPVLRMLATGQFPRLQDRVDVLVERESFVLYRFHRGHRGDRFADRRRLEHGVCRHGRARPILTSLMTATLTPGTLNCLRRTSMSATSMGPGAYWTVGAGVGMGAGV